MTTTLPPAVDIRATYYHHHHHCRRPLQICIVPQKFDFSPKILNAFQSFYSGGSFWVRRALCTNTRFPIRLGSEGYGGVFKGSRVEKRSHEIAPNSWNNDDITVDWQNDFHLRHRFIYARALQCPFRKSYSRWLNFSAWNSSDSISVFARP